ncbi:uncharacterized protein LOC123721709 [Papilio machaon]|uniref:uncharacterized protein LOC123721709 n=1 Tax=Papilio machaon TaxID=76193 RepID=UPI001E664DD9|nr:uncharacterized protein LOC123721709 [Papilio machaon]
MSLQRTPPGKFASDTDIPATIDIGFVNSRKRKQPDCDGAQTLDCIERLSKTISNELTKITSTLTDINNKMTKLQNDNININKSLGETNERLSEIEKSLNFLSERQDGFETRLKALEGQITRTPDLTIQLATIENKISLMEQQARQCNLEISNIKERRGENLVQIVENLGNIIKQPIRAADVVAVHRVPHADQNNKRPKNIIVKFTSRILRDNFISASRATKGLNSTMLSITGSPAPLYVNEHLTLNNKILFRQSREAAKKHGFRYVWVKHGVILARKTDTSPVIAIRTDQDIEKFK